MEKLPGQLHVCTHPRGAARGDADLRSPREWGGGPHVAQALPSTGAPRRAKLGWGNDRVKVWQIPEGLNTNIGIFSGQRHGSKPQDNEVCVRRDGREQPHET